MVNAEIRLIIFFAAKDGKALYSQQKTRPGANCRSDHELLIAKLWLKLKEVGKTTRPFRYAGVAKLLQLCLSVWPHRWQPTRLLCPWDSPGKNTGVGCHFLLQCVKVKSERESHVQLFETPWTVAYQAPPSMGFSRQEYWSGLPFPFPIQVWPKSNPLRLYSRVTDSRDYIW